MSYKRMLEAEPELAAVVARWMEEAAANDRTEDDAHGDRRGDEIPAHVKEKIRKLAQIEAAKARLEREAAERAAQAEEERRRRAQETGRAAPEPNESAARPKDKAQSNFTDPESRIMLTKGGFEQAYNCQAAVDSDHQVIVACDVVARQTDVEQLQPVVARVREFTGELPRQISADAGYCSEANIQAMEDLGVDAYIAPGRQKHGTPIPTSERDERARKGSRTAGMREKLRRDGFESPYRLRKQVVEPVFGQIKQARGFRQFLLRGLAKAKLEWSLLSTTHNLLKLHAGRKRSLS